MEERYEIKHLEKFMPYPFIDKGNSESDNRIYGQIYLDEITFFGEGYNEGGKLRISASLVNKVMIDMEYEAMESQNPPLFFYEFTGEATFNDLRELAKHKLRLGKFEGLYKFRIIDIEDSDADLEIIREQFRNRVMFMGEITFSASPIVTHKVILVVEERTDGKDEEAYRKLIATYDKWDATRRSQCVYDEKKIQDELNNLFGNKVVCRNVYIYNVGQANCCYCDLDTKKLFFDIGVTRSSKEIKNSLIQKAITEISKLDTDAVVLSHWDLDHILGVCYNQKCLSDKIWLVPDFEKLYSVPRLSIKRLCNYLLMTGKSKVLMVDTSVANKSLFVSSNKAVAFYKGTPKAAYGINKMNNGGLIMKLQNSKNILLPGDCENSVIPLDVAGKEYDNVIVPHHGSVMSDPKVKGKKGKKNAAYICCGNVTGHCIMDSQIVDKYNANGFERVHKTKNLIRKKIKFKISL